MLNNEIEMGYPFEIMISNLDGDFSKYKEYIEKNAKVRGMYEYQMYNIPKTTISKAFEGTTFEGRDFEELDSILGLTDYNALREMLGYEKVSLKEDEVIIQCMKTAEKTFTDYTAEHQKLKIGEKEVTVKEVRAEHFAQTFFNGYIYCVIVSDDLLEEVKKMDFQLDSSFYDGNYNLVVQTEEPTTEEFYRGLSQYIVYDEIEQTAVIDGKEQTYTVNIALGNVSTKGYRMSVTKSFYTMVSFLAFYIALIFVMATATILAIQQLSDSEKYKYRYELLKKLGMEEQEMNRTILKQLFFYFGLPMLVPILISIPAVLIIGQIFTIAVTVQEMFVNMVMVIGMFILVYGIYFIATNVQFERNINGGM